MSDYEIAITRCHETSPQAILISRNTGVALRCREVGGVWEALHLVGMDGIYELPSCFVLSSELRDMLSAAVGPYITDCFENARCWIAECDWANLDPEDIEGLTNHQIRIGVNHHYEGGWSAFCADYERSRSDIHPRHAGRE